MSLSKFNFSSCFHTNCILKLSSFFLNVSESVLFCSVIPIEGYPYFFFLKTQLFKILILQKYYIHLSFKRKIKSVFAGIKTDSTNVFFTVMIPFFFKCQLGMLAIAERLTQSSSVRRYSMYNEGLLINFESLKTLLNIYCKIMMKVK